MTPQVAALAPRFPTQLSFESAEAATARESASSTIGKNITPATVRR